MIKFTLVFRYSLCRQLHLCNAWLPARSLLFNQSVCRYSWLLVMFYLLIISPLLTVVQTLYTWCKTVLSVVGIK